MPRRCQRSLTASLPFLLFLLCLGGCATHKETTPSSGSATSPTPATDTGDFEKTTLTGPRGGTLLLGDLGAGAKTFNLLVAQEASSSSVVGVMFDGLVTRDAETLAIKPALAKSWETSPDRKTWTFHLRRGLRWSDGQPLTSDDVVFTLDVIYDPKVDTMSREVLKVDGKPLRYEKLDEQTVRITTPTPFGPFLDTAGFSIMPKHVLEGPWKAGKFNSTWGVDTPPAQLVGSGAFLLSQYAGAQKAVYKRNPYYWKLGQDGQQLPLLAGSLSQFISDQNALLLKFRGRETDSLSVRAEDWSGIQQGQQAGNYRAMNLGPAWGMLFITFNMNPRATRVPAYKREWFSRKEFRQAVSYALNRDSMVENVFRGLAHPQWSPVSEANKVFYNPKVRQYPYDPSRARALLAGMGFADKNGDGILEDTAGHPLEFVLITNVENNQRVSLCNIVQDDLKKVGMKVTVSPAEFNSLVRRVGSTNDWECVLLGITGGPEPHLGKSVWTTPGHLHAWNPRQPKPATPWEAEIDRIFSEAAKEIDTAKRKALYDRWQEIAAEQQPLIFLVTPDYLGAIRNRVKNTRPSSLGLLWNSDELAIGA